MPEAADNRNPMMTGDRFKLPAMSTLIAFEATARLGSVKLAAKELATSQPAISRRLRTCETALGTKLFERSGRGIVLTHGGEDYYGTVRSALKMLRDAGDTLRTRQACLTIGCTQEISILLLLPIFTRLRRAIGNEAKIRILSCDYDTLPLVTQVGVDIIFEYSNKREDADSVRILNEEIVPLASPALARRIERVAARHPRHWVGVPRLELSGGQNQGWATWPTWFSAHGCDAPQAPVECFESYLNVLEAAADGDGIALGWNGFTSGHFRKGRLVAIRKRWLRTRIGLYAVRTPSSRAEPAVERCLQVLETLVRTLTSQPVTSERARTGSNSCAANALDLPFEDRAAGVETVLSAN